MRSSIAMLVAETCMALPSIANLPIMLQLLQRSGAMVSACRLERGIRDASLRSPRIVQARVGQITTKLAKGKLTLCPEPSE